MRLKNEKTYCSKKEDADIYSFLNTIPKGERKEIVPRILSSTLRGRVLNLPMNFVIKNLRVKAILNLIFLITLWLNAKKSWALQEVSFLAL